MNRYQPAEQLIEGVLWHMIVDTKQNTIYHEKWAAPEHRDSAIADMNARADAPSPALQAHLTANAERIAAETLAYQASYNCEYEVAAREVRDAYIEGFYEEHDADGQVTAEFDNSGSGRCG
jgi:hypothetical protein